MLPKIPVYHGIGHHLGFLKYTLLISPKLMSFKYLSRVFSRYKILFFLPAHSEGHFLDLYINTIKYESFRKSLEKQIIKWFISPLKEEDQ